MKFLILIFLICVDGQDEGKKNIIDQINNYFFIDMTNSTGEHFPTTLSKNNIINTPYSPPNFDPIHEIINSTCKCVPYYLCENETINVDGSSVYTVRINIDIVDDCEESLDVCCGKGKTKRKPEVASRLTPSQFKGCGSRNPDGIGFHIEGPKSNKSQFGEFPWMLAILYEQMLKETGEKLLAYKCGGSLIHPQVALTSAHYVFTEVSKLIIRAGEWDTKHPNEIYQSQDRKVSEIIIHPNFDLITLENDIALLVFETPLDIFQHIDTVCLPLQDEILENSRCFASGWGKDKFQRKGKYQTVLKKLELPIVPRNKCQNELRNTVLGKDFYLADSFICAGGEIFQDMCTGDGGSPLVCPMPGQPNKYYQRGIVSWGVECGFVGIPGLYTNVAKFRNWIDTQMLRLNYGTSTYTL